VPKRRQPDCRIGTVVAQNDFREPALLNQLLEDRDDMAPRKAASRRAGQAFAIEVVQDIQHERQQFPTDFIRAFVSRLACWRALIHLKCRTLRRSFNVTNP